MKVESCAICKLREVFPIFWLDGEEEEEEARVKGEEGGWDTVAAGTIPKMTRRVYCAAHRRVPPTSCDEGRGAFPCLMRSNAEGGGEGGDRRGVEKLVRRLMVVPSSLLPSRRRCTVFCF